MVMVNVSPRDTGVLFFDGEKNELILKKKIIITRWDRLF